MRQNQEREKISREIGQKGNQTEKEIGREIGQKRKFAKKLGDGKSTKETWTFEKKLGGERTKTVKEMKIGSLKWPLVEI